jgi:carbon monoxide dehydrogenase subunit G
MPGARITERVSDQLYKGTVAVKFGPASMSFRGDVEVVSLDPANRSLHIIGKGTDSTGGSGATMDLNARVEAVDTGSARLVGHSEVSMSGKAAAFGGRMINSVADQLLKQFASNFSARVQASQPAETPVPATAASSAAVPTAASVPQPRALNGWALIWTAIRGWLRGLFAGKGT